MVEAGDDLARAHRLALIKAAVAAAGLAVFWIGVRWDNATARWVGIAAVAAAWLLRLIKAPGASAATPDDQPPETR